MQIATVTGLSRDGRSYTVHTDLGDLPASGAGITHLQPQGALLTLWLEARARDLGREARAYRRPSTADAAGNMGCTGCGEVKPMHKFPTKQTREGTVRLSECRACRDERRAMRAA